MLYKLVDTTNGCVVGISLYEQLIGLRNDVFGGDSVRYVICRYEDCLED